VSIDFSPPQGDPLGNLKVFKMLGAGQLKNGHFSFAAPLTQ
jgi:hypothetical protein